MPATATAKTHTLMNQISKGRKARPRRVMLYGTHGIGKSTFGAMAEDQHLLAPVREHAKCRTALLRSEAEDPDEAMMKWFAGKGILFCSLLGINPLDDEGVDRLFRQLEKTGERG